MQIPFNRPFIVGRELEYISQAVAGGQVSGDGAFTRKCSEFLEHKLRAKRVLLTTSCTAALEMCALLCNIGPHDEVILPSFTFVSTANAFFLRGAKPVFVEIREDTLNIDESHIAASINNCTRAIVPVHYAGIACQMDIILELGRRHGIYVIEDAAQGLGCKFGDSYLGTLGELGAYSFHETKNVQCGEGGALVINEDTFLERAEIIREKGTNRRKYFQGKVDKYTWVDIGSSYLPSDILAAFLFAQLEHMDEINAKRGNITKIYHDALLPLRERGFIAYPGRDRKAGFSNHSFYVLLESHTVRDRLMEYLKEKGILAVFHYVPLHLSDVGRSLGYRLGQLPRTESISARLLRLPVYFDMTFEEQKRVIDSIKAFFETA